MTNDSRALPSRAIIVISVVMLVEACSLQLALTTSRPFKQATSTPVAFALEESQSLRPLPDMDIDTAARPDVSLPPQLLQIPDLSVPTVTSLPGSRCGVLFEEDFEGTSFSMGATSFCDGSSTFWDVVEPLGLSPVDNPMIAGEGTHSAWTTGSGDPLSYGPGACAALYTPYVEFTGAAAPLLSFKIFYRTERSYDGLSILISPESGGDWFLVEPVSGYPVPSVESLGTAGYSGVVPGWQDQQVDLSLAAATSPSWIIIFYFASDESIGDLGVLIDSVRIEAPCAPSPSPTVIPSATPTPEPEPTATPCSPVAPCQ